MGPREGRAHAFFPASPDVGTMVSDTTLVLAGGAAVALVGLWAAVTLYAGARDRRASEPVEGRVVSSAVEVPENDPDYVGHGDPPSAVPDVTVEFDYRGDTHRTSTVYPGEVVGRTTLTVGSATDVAARYSPGDTVTVHVPEGSPERAYLEDGVTGRTVGLAVALLASALVLGVLAWAVATGRV